MIKLHAIRRAHGRGTAVSAGAGASSRFGRAAVATTVLISGLVGGAVALAPAALADGSTPPPVQERNASTVTSDALPTVQLDDGVVWTQVVNGNTDYVGGSFSNARPYGAAKGTNLSPRSNLLSFDVTTGNLQPFAPTLNGQVKALALSPDKTRLYVGGSFTTVNGATHYKLAAFDTATGNLITTFNAQVGGSSVNAIAATNSAVYVGGLFTQANGLARTNLAAYDLNGKALAWAPTTDLQVDAMVMTPALDKVIVGGRFSTVNGSPQRGLVALSPADGSTLPWAAPNTVVNGDSSGKAGIFSLSADSTTVYGTGWVFADVTVGNLEGSFAADPATGNIKWLEDCHGDTYSSYSDNTNVYVTGHPHDCSGVGGYPQKDPAPGNMHHLLAFTAAPQGTLTRTDNVSNIYKDWSGQPAPAMINWFPDMDTGTFTKQGQSAWSLAGNGQYVVAGGEFPTVNNRAQYGLTRFARPAISGSHDGPRLAGTKWVATGISPTSGQVRVSIPQDYDRDNRDLTYTLRRANGTSAPSATATPIYTTTMTSEFWTSTPLSYKDTGLTPGNSYTYQWSAADSDGNTVKSAPVTLTVTTKTLGAYAQDVVDTGAAHYWRLDEASGSVGHDLVGSGDLTEGTGVAQGASSALQNDADTAATFDGTSNGSAVPSGSEVGPNVFSVGAWFKTTSTSGGKIIGFGDAVAGAQSNNYDRHVYLDNAGHVIFGVYNNGVNTVSTPGTYNDGSWHQVVASLSGSGMVLFLDGKRIAVNAGITAGQPFTGFWHVGGDNLGGWPSQPSSNYLAGTIDEVAVWPSALNGNQVQQQWIDSGRAGTVQAAPTDAYGKAVYQTDPDLYLRLDDASGPTATDASSYAINGSYFGGVSYGQASPVSGSGGKAVVFDGNGGGAGSGNAYGNPTSYSEQLWFNTTTTSGGKLIGFGDNPNGWSNSYDRMVYMTNDGHLIFGAYTGNTVTVTSPASYNDGAWHFLTATQDAGGMKLYVDGALVGSDPNSSAQSYSGYWRVGGDNLNGWPSAPSSFYFAGAIDEVAVHLRALSAAEINGIYQASPVATSTNKPPTASFTSQCTNLSCSFDASASSDSDGTVASYAWNFGDGVTGTGKTPTHAYSSAGSYTVTLTVTDNGAASGSTTQTVVASAPANQAPTAAFTSSCSVLTCSFDSTGSADPDGTIASYAWDFGDGSTGSGASPSHTYANGGSYSVTLTVTDNGGRTGTVSHTVTVAAPVNRAPVAAFTQSCTALGCSFDSSGSSDPDGTIAGYAWDFGDGSTSSTASPSHTYTTGGSYTVTLTVTDNGGLTNTASHAVTVSAPVSSVIAADAFARTVSGGWGTADTGGAWTVTGTASAFSTNGSTARVTVSKAGSGPYATLKNVSAQDVQGTVDVSFNNAPTGGGSYAWMTVRQTTQGDYEAAVKVLPASTTIYLRKVVGTTTTNLASKTLSQGYTAGDVLRIKLLVTGTSPTQLSAKVWKVGTTEPAAYQVTTTDSESALQTAGSISLHGYLSGSSTPPTTVSFDNLDVRKP